MKKVTIWGNFYKLKEQLTLDEILNRFKIGIYAYIIRRLRKLLQEGNKSGYDLLKKTLDAVTFCASFLRVRKADHAIDYNSLIILDIDNLTEAQLARVRPIIEHCKYTLACFLSPSGQGLKVLVQVSTGIADHLMAFNGARGYYEKLIGVVIDKSGSDVTRLCFVTFDPELYYNKGATIFDPNQSDVEALPDPPVDAGMEKRNIENPPQTDIDAEMPLLAVPPLTPKQMPPIVDVQPDKTEPVKMVVDVLKTYRKCIARTERYHTFIEGQRNKFVFTLSLKLCRAGIPKETALQLILQDYNFDEHEVRTCVKSGYSYTGTEKTAAKRGYGEKREQPVSKPGWETIMPSEQAAEPQQDNLAGQPDEPDPASTATADKPPQLMNKGAREQFNIRKVEEILRYLFVTRRNLVTGMVELRERNTKKRFRRLDDAEENSLLRMLYYNKQKIPQSMLHAILNSDYSPAYHPFRSYFKNLSPWDRQHDYIGQLAATVRTKDDRYWNLCFRKWFVAFAMGLIVDEIVNHTVIVFIGAQGLGKTSWCTKLMPRSLANYIGTAALHADSKDMAIQLSECGLILFDDFESLGRKDLALFKEVVTRSEINVRRPYCRNAENLVRRASFVAAVNHDKVLTDLTGSRRYLCFVVNSIDYQHEVDIDGCMAQAYALYMSGFQFWFDQEQIVTLTDHNEDFMSKSVMEELIMVWIRKVPRPEWDNRDKIANGESIRTMTATQIAVFLLEKARFMLNDAIVVQIGKIMNKLGFEYVKKGNQHYYILRIVDAEAVEKESYPPMKAAEESKEIEENRQIINLEEDLSGSAPTDDLPF